MLQADTKTEVLNKTKASEIYSMIQGAPELSLAELASVQDTEYLYTSLLDVKSEIDRIVRELREYKNGKLLQAEVSHFTEEGEKVIDSEAVYYEYTTDEDLAEQVSSDYLDVMTIIEDVLNR